MTGLGVPIETGERRAVRSAIAPMFGEPRISSSMTSQLLAGAIIDVLELRDEWMRVRSADAYEGWMHSGYVARIDGDEHARRRSLGCTIQRADGRHCALPLGALLRPSDTVVVGDAISRDAQLRLFPANAPAIADSASERYDGASYLWGGVTPWGCDCSGFVQQIFALHGVDLPRDAWQQATFGVAVGARAGDDLLPGDLLFFSDRDDQRITHVGVALSDRRMVHSALRRGGIAVEQLTAEDPYIARLRTQCVGVRSVVPS